MSNNNDNLTAFEQFISNATSLERAGWSCNTGGAWTGPFSADTEFFTLEEALAIQEAQNSIEHTEE